MGEGYRGGVSRLWYSCQSVRVAVASVLLSGPFTTRKEWDAHSFPAET